MNTRRTVILILAVVVAILAVFYYRDTVRGKKVPQLSVAEQLTAIQQAQTRMEQRLTAIEKTQQSIAFAMRKMTGSRPQAQAAAPQRPPVDMDKVYPIEVGAAPVRGNPDAKVTIVEFSEVQCPYSQRFHPVLSEVLAAYPKDIKLIFKHFPLNFHPNARPAAKAMLAAAEQGKYWEMLDLLFENGRDLSDEKYTEFAKQLGMDVEKFTKDLKEKDSQWEEMIEKDVALARSVNVRGTPTCFINGKLTRARTLEAFKQEIDALLAEGSQE